MFYIWSGPKGSVSKQRGNRVLDFIQNWARIQKITISFDNSCSTVFGKPKILQRVPLFKLHGKDIKSEKTINYVGIKIDQQLPFLPQMALKRQELIKITQNLLEFAIF